jgi:hypothetical protein
MVTGWSIKIERKGQFKELLSLEGRKNYGNEILSKLQESGLDEGASKLFADRL